MPLPFSPSEKSKLTISPDWPQAERDALIEIIRTDAVALADKRRDAFARQKPDECRAIGVKIESLPGLIAMLKEGSAGFLEVNRGKFSDYIE